MEIISSSVKLGMSKYMKLVNVHKVKLVLIGKKYQNTEFLFKYLNKFLFAKPHYIRHIL